MIKNRIFKQELSIVIAGEAGQGIQTIELLLTKLLKKSGYNVFATKEYMSRVRGGANSTQIRIGSNPVCSYVENIDFLLVLNSESFERSKKTITQSTIVIGDKKTLNTQDPIVDIPFSELAKGVGGVIFSNIVVAGFLCGMLGLERGLLNDLLKKMFLSKGEDIVNKNILASIEGFKQGQEFVSNNSLSFEIGKNKDISNQLFLNATQAIALGAIAGGCNFISSYPMSPSTGVLVFLAQQAEKFGIVVEQAEDEISAINMALGAWYAGSKALVTTSGGGFALMTEGISLAGCIESPLVVHLAQRPGPATGLPTRTEQGDLEFALYSGHGEFPRVIFTPGNIQDAFFCAREAFLIADKYQVPVIILTDQYFLDSYYNLSDFSASIKPIDNYFVKTAKDYKRYQFTESGVSERGIPGFGEGLVCADSDEHDESGYITEDLELRVKMVDKRLKKKELLVKDAVKPELIGSSDYKKLIIGWGSTYHSIKEALAKTKDPKTSFLYLKQVYPLPEGLTSYMSKAKEIIVVENNATGQLAKLIRQETGITVNRKVLKYNGLMFSVEELIEKLYL